MAPDATASLEKMVSDRLRSGTICLEEGETLLVIICVFRGFIYRKDLKRLHRTLSPFQLIGMQFPWEPVARSCCNRDLLDGIIFSSAYSLDACWDK